MTPRSPLFIVFFFLLLAILIPSISAWKKDEFRNCNQTPFCKRARFRRPHTIPSFSASDISISDGSVTARLLPRRPRLKQVTGSESDPDPQPDGPETRPLILHLSVYSSGVLRLKIDEDYSESVSKRRFQIPDVLLPDLDERRLYLSRFKSTDGGSSVFFITDDFEAVITHDPFEIVVRRSSGPKDPILSLNSYGLFDFETLRVKKEGEDWAERFRSHTDSRPHGPQSISFDLSFHGAEFVYGIPEHGSESLALRYTRGPGVDQSEPYRLFSLDVFEYVHESPFGIYGSIPFMLSHGAKSSAGFFWLNAAEMQIDVLSPGWSRDDVDDNKNKRVDTLWMTEAGVEGQSCLISSAFSSACEQESKWVSMSFDPINNNNNKHIEEINKKNRKKKRGSMNECPSSSSSSSSNELISPIGRDISIHCLLLCSRSDYGALASLNRSFRSLIRGGELYRLRRRQGITEHWVYFSCNVLEWEAYDPHGRRWIALPQMPSDDCFMCSDKESLAVGTELLVFGKVVTSHIVLRYSMLTNSWSPGLNMTSPRCLFGSASLGEKAVIAGGIDTCGNILSSAELYNSELQAWVTLPNMNRPRKMCSCVFMDNKFYVIGGMASNTEVLTCGEEYDLGKGVWRVIPNMSSGLNRASGSPPLVAVVGNELYAADYGEKVVRKYGKASNSWATLGGLPERSMSMNGWGLAFRACGERLIVIGGSRGGSGGGMIELNSWIPDGGPPRWEMIASKHSGSFVYNCAVMGC